MKGDDVETGCRMKLFVFFKIDLRGNVFCCGTFSLSRSDSDDVMC